MRFSQEPTTPFNVIPYTKKTYSQFYRPLKKHLETMPGGIGPTAFSFSADEDEVVNRWPENPYWQYLCDETFYQHRPPIVRSGLSKWRKRIKSKGKEALFQQSLVVGLNVVAVKQSSLKRVSVDTTVQPKATAHPTNTKLLNHSREHLVNLPRREPYITPELQTQRATD